MDMSLADEDVCTILNQSWLHVFTVESEMEWLVIPEREKKLLLSCYKLNFTYIRVINNVINIVLLN